MGTEARSGFGVILAYASRMPQRGETQMANFKMAILGTLGVAAARRWRGPSFPSPVAAPCFTPMPIARIRGRATPTPIPTTSAARTPQPGRAIRRSALRREGGRASTLPRRTCINISYFSELLSDANFELSLPPIPFTVEMIISEIPAAISPYSIAVAPDSSARNFFSIFIAVASPVARCVATRAVHNSQFTIEICDRNSQSKSKIETTIAIRMPDRPLNGFSALDGKPLIYRAKERQ